MKIILVIFIYFFTITPIFAEENKGVYYIMMLINLVLGFFSLLIVLSILKIVFPNVKEGATGSCDLEKDPTYLAKLNAAKLKAMEEEFGEAKKLKEDIEILTELVKKNANNRKVNLEFIFE